jgi:cytochrome c biogenesis protein CcmG/thiol:disulfide interchange protein DsbE
VCSRRLPLTEANLSCAKLTGAQQVRGKIFSRAGDEYMSQDNDDDNHGAARTWARWTRRHVMAGGALTMLGACTEAASAPLPQVTLPPLQGLRSGSGWPVPGIGPETFRRGVTVLNVWASWCPYCQSEHGLLRQMSQDGRYALVGLVYRDTPDAALAYLRKAGNPFHAVGVDSGSALSRPLRQRGVPHTYVIDRQARVLTRVQGALSAQSLATIIQPAVIKARDA